MKKILIIGAGFLQAYVIRKARELGYYVYAVDGNPHAVGFTYAHEYAAVNIVDKEACLAYAREHQIDGVMTAATDYGVLSASHIATEMNLPGNPYAAAELIKNKYLVRKRLFEAHIDDTEQAYEIRSMEDLDQVREKIHYPVMVKPCDGSGSRGACKVESESELAAAVQNAMDASITRRAEIETFIFGREYGVESFVCGDQVHVMAVMQKEMTQPPYYAELGHAIPSGLPAEVENRVKAAAEAAIRALGLTCGAVNMDLLIDKDNGLHIVDIGARMGGNLIGSHIVPAGTGIDYIGNLIRTAVGDPICMDPIQKPMPVATRLLALTPGVVKALPDFDELAKAYNVTIEHHLNIGDQINEYHTNLDGCGYVVARAEDIDAAQEKAVRAKAAIDEAITRA